MCLPCCPTRGGQPFYAALDLDVDAQNDISDFCKKICSIFKDAFSAPDSQHDIYDAISSQFGPDVDAARASKIIAQHIPNAIVAQNFCLVAQLIVQVIGLLMGNTVGRRAQDLLDENRQRIVELISKVIGQLIVEIFCNGMQLPPDIPGPGPSPGMRHNPDDQGRGC